jgi:putative membrane protein
MSHTHQVGFGSIWVSAALIFAAMVYLTEWLRFRRLDRESVGGWHSASFALGLLFTWDATASPLSVFDHEMLTAHMVQHLLLMTLAPPLILLGVPVKPLVHGPLQRFLQAIARPLRSAPMQKIGRALAHPALCWFAAAGALVVWHIPWMFTLGLRSQMWHGIEQVSFLASGLLFWWPVVKPCRSASKWPESSLLVYLFLATLPCDILSGFLVFCDRVVYPVFLSSPRSFGLSALEDQQCAGALMWTCVTIVYLIAAAIVTARLLSSHGSQEYAIRQSETRAVALRKNDVQRMEVV